jgi:hypothetical protein
MDLVQPINRLSLSFLANLNQNPEDDHRADDYNSQ